MEIKDVARIATLSALNTELAQIVLAQEQEIERLKLELSKKEDHLEG